MALLSSAAAISQSEIAVETSQDTLVSQDSPPGYEERYPPTHPPVVILTEVRPQPPSPNDKAKHSRCRYCLSLTVLAIVASSLLIAACLFILIGALPSFQNIQVRLDQSNGQGISVDTQSQPLTIHLDLLVSGSLESQSYIPITVNGISVKVLDANLLLVAILMASFTGLFSFGRRCRQQTLFGHW